MLGYQDLKNLNGDTLPMNTTNLKNKIKDIAQTQNWVFLVDQPKTSMLSFEKQIEAGKKPVRMNIYYTAASSIDNFNLTVATCLDHPKKGKTQLFRKKVSESQLNALFLNPRKHTKKGYYQK